MDGHKKFAGNGYGARKRMMLREGHSTFGLKDNFNFVYLMAIIGCFLCIVQTL